MELLVPTKKKYGTSNMEPDPGKINDIENVKQI